MFVAQKNRQGKQPALEDEGFTKMPCLSGRCNTATRHALVKIKTKQTPAKTGNTKTCGRRLHPFFPPLSNNAAKNKIKHSQVCTQAYLAKEFKGADDVPLVFRTRLEHVEHGNLGSDVVLGNLVRGSERRRHIEMDAVVDRESCEGLSGTNFLCQDKKRHPRKTKAGRERKGLSKRSELKHKSQYIPSRQ